jgi:hypothetical protein
VRREDGREYQPQRTRGEREKNDQLNSSPRNENGTRKREIDSSGAGNSPLPPHRKRRLDNDQPSQRELTLNYQRPEGLGRCTLKAIAQPKDDRYTEQTVSLRWFEISKDVQAGE